MRLRVALVLVPHMARSCVPHPLTRHFPTDPLTLGCFVSEPPLDSCELGAHAGPAGALALGPQTFSGYTGTNLLPPPQLHRLWGRTGYRQAAGLASVGVRGTGELGIRV